MTKTKTPSKPSVNQDDAVLCWPRVSHVVSVLVPKHINSMSSVNQDYTAQYRLRVSHFVDHQQCPWQCQRNIFTSWLAIPFIEANSCIDHVILTVALHMGSFSLRHDVSTLRGATKCRKKWGAKPEKARFPYPLRGKKTTGCHNINCTSP